MEKLIFTISALLAASAVYADTVLFSQDFNGDYSEDFPTILELDHLPPAANVSPLFQNLSGVSMPWWHIKDANVSPDRMFASHSIYMYGGGTSNDWAVTRPVTITGKGFNLSFDAQSCIMRDLNNLSDLWVYITETPVTATSLPTEPTMHIEKVSYGDDSAFLEGDFTHYTLNMDPWEGKTIYVAFANLNTDKDILVIDNVKIDRKDPASISFLSVPQPFVENGEYQVEIDAECIREGGLQNLTLTFKSTGNAGSEDKVEVPLNLSRNERVRHTFTANIKADEFCNYEVTLSGEGFEPIILSGSVTGLAFVPQHKVLFEEATGAWCSNCPLGIYTVEQMMESPVMRDRVVPVAIHNNSSSDYMVDLNYSALFGVTQAPVVRLERADNFVFFSGLDTQFDPYKQNTVANKVLELSNITTPVDIALEAEHVDDPSNKLGKIKCEVEVTPAKTLSGDYGIGIVMTENNVNNTMSYQENGYSGNDIEGNLGGWTLLPKSVKNMHYQDVARGVWGFNGLPNSLPSALPMGEPQKFSYEVEVPDVEYILTAGSKEIVCAGPVNVNNLVMVAFVLDRNTGKVLNATSTPLTEEAEKRVTTKELVEMNGVDGITADADITPVYYNLQGIRLAAPVQGTPVIERRGSKSRIIIVK